MTRRPFSVRYNESFLRKTKNLLSEDDLKKLSELLCDDPFDGLMHEDVENLYKIEWVSDADSANEEFDIWYVADINVNHIEVIAITTKKDDDDRDLKNRGNNQWTGRLVRLLVRLMYAFYRLYRNWPDDESESSDISDFGP